MEIDQLLVIGSRMGAMSSCLLPFHPLKVRTWLLEENLPAAFILQLPFL